MKHLQLIILAASLSSVGVFAYAASGGSPNGKPFVEINGQITEIKMLQISIEERLTNYFSRIISLESATDVLGQNIADLENQNYELSQYMDNLNSGLMTLSGVADHINERISSLEEWLVLQQGDVATLEAQLNDYYQLQILIQQELSVVLVELSDRISENQEVLSTLEFGLAEMQEALKFKQDIIAGVCPEGEVVYGIGSDSSLACASAASSSEISYVTVYQVNTHTYQRYSEWISMKCPENTIIVSGGWDTVFFNDRAAEQFNISGSQMDGNGWKVKLSQYRDVTYAITGFAYCRELN
jgi:hypothetical protein